MKAIKLEDINELAIYNSVSEEKFVSYDDLKHLYDNAPSVGNSEPVAIVSNAVAQHTRTGKFNTINTCLLAGTKLYTTPQPDRVAELEATVKSYNEFLASGTPKEYRAKVAELEAKLKELKQALGQTAKAVIAYSDYWHDKGNLDKANKYNDMLGRHQKLIADVEAIDQAMKG